MGQFSNWVAENCGLSLRTDEVAAVMRHIDKNRDCVMTRDEFIKNVSPDVQEEEEGE